MASIQSGKSMQPVYCRCVSQYIGEKNQVGAQSGCPLLHQPLAISPVMAHMEIVPLHPLPREKDILLNASSKRAPNRYYTLTNFDSCMHLLKTNCFCSITHLFLKPYKFYSLAIQVTFEHDHIPPIK